MDIGGKVKELRQQKNLTLRDLGERTDLSIGFLSEFERGLTTIAVDSLQKIAEALQVDLSSLVAPPTNHEEEVIRMHMQTVSRIEGNSFLHTYLSKNLDTMKLFPELIVIQPNGSNEEVKPPFSHEGEEFMYVLEGILTLVRGSKTTAMYPGDSVHFSSQAPHNWYNATNKVVKILVVHLPNPFMQE